ncbi:glycosylphosphatidylinositol anchor attachment 1 protein [Leptopilina boulardi]|uniref:glycosylphosphatidylinositol anchor attachment 1 protein n=1 Tax=Leptopilina boulardi TaxID=63433 RepID=UPI0021F688A9|nr:glycosylphosphatidylinositol anchor attachment 1 protein [Leptopilina boulardi]
MGLLTDPRAGNMKLIKFILRWEKSLCFLMYLGGIVWTMLLATPTFSDNTYFSENALLPGLVTKESNLMYDSKIFYQELMREMEKQRTDALPVAWMSARFRQLHLDTYIHNFTLNHPFRKQKFTGKNVYGIVRAPRSVSTESIVINVPYRSLSSIHPTTAPSIALLLAFAQFCRKQKYWAKDIIFLVTEHEQLGIQAWLDAYHGVTSGQDDVLLAGDLPGRAGSIQAAIVLEMHAMKITSIDVKVEGLNGQLPNLDLFNLAQNMIHKEDIRRSVQQRFDYKSENKYNKWLYRGKTMAMMIMSQATGVPTGNHGLFHRFGIEAITLEGFEKTTNGPEANFSKVGRVVESIVRSLNNLLERFHQSYFFYLLPSTDRYVSIGIYTLPLVLMLATLFIKAFSIWLRLQELTPDLKKETEEEKIKKELKEEEMKTNKKKKSEFDIGYVTMEILRTHILGFLLMSSSRLLISSISDYFKWHTENSTYFCLATVFVFTILFPLLRPKRKDNFKNAALICIVTSIELGTALMCVEIHNFSLALLIAVIFVPFTLLIPIYKNSMKGFYKILYIIWPLLHPFIVASFIVTGYTYVNFREERLMTIFYRGWKATKQSFVLSIIDSTIYGNWLYSFIVSIMLPIWKLYWNVINSS